MRIAHATDRNLIFMSWVRFDTSAPFCINKLMNIKLTHYTSSIEAICNILLNGFAYVPNKRQLISDLIPSHDFSKGEPQQFGMISFTELSPDRTKEHREKFGELWDHYIYELGY